MKLYWPMLGRLKQCLCRAQTNLLAFHLYLTCLSTSKHDDDGDGDGDDDDAMLLHIAVP